MGTIFDATFFDTMIASVAVGSLYALVALGYTMVYGILKFINFAHSDVFVLGAWTAFTTTTALVAWTGLSATGAPWWLGPIVLGVSMVVCGVTAFCVERFAYRPLRKAPRLNVLITAIGVSLLLQNFNQLPPAPGLARAAGVSFPFGPTPKTMPELLPDVILNESAIASGTLGGGQRRGQVVLDRDVTVLPGRTYRLDVTRQTEAGPVVARFNLNNPPEGLVPAGTTLVTQPLRPPAEMQGLGYALVQVPAVTVRLVDVTIVGTACVLMVGLLWLVFRTRLGAAMRAVSFSIENAALMGVNVNFVISFTFVLGACLAAAAGFLYPIKYPSLQQPASDVWVLLGLKAFVAAVVGGIGNIRGAVLGGFLIAFIEFFGETYLSGAIGSGLQDIYVFTTLILVLLLRPAGLLGTPVREKV